jgi:cardiolipin synthase A/B
MIALPGNRRPDALLLVSGRLRARLPPRAALRRAARRAGLGVLHVLAGLVAIVGLLFLTRGTAVHRVRAIGGEGAPVAPVETAFPAAVAVLTGAPMAGGNRIEIALDGDGTFPRLWADLRSARRSITVQLYYAAAGGVADTLAAILRERAAAGVMVWLLYDAFGSALPHAYLGALRADGVRVAAFRPFRLKNLWVVQNRSHVRGIVVDGSIGWTGGFGLDDKWLGAGRRPAEWRETNARFEGPAVRQLEAAFVAGWAEATGELLTGRLPMREEAPGDAVAGVLFTAPTLGSTPAERYLALSIAGARERLYVTNSYFAPDTNFAALLAGAARRGVDVRLLVGGPRTDIRAARLVARGRYEALLEAGVRIYEYQPTTLHAKTFVVDGRWVSIGSMNFDNRSLALNDEATLMVLDTAVGRRMEAVFLDDLRHARRIELQAFRRRSWTERVAEWAAMRLTPVL